MDKKLIETFTRFIWMDSNVAIREIAKISIDKRQ